MRNAAVKSASAGKRGRCVVVVVVNAGSFVSRCAETARDIKLLIIAIGLEGEHGTALVDLAGNNVSEVVISIN